MPRVRRAARLALFAPLALGCGELDPAAALDLRVEDVAGATPAAYRVVATSRDGAVSAVDCPGENAGLRCVSGGLRFQGSAPPAELELKAPGFRFERVELSNRERPALVRLTALPAFERADSYATGFGADGAAAAWQELAVESHTELGPAFSLKFYLEGLDAAPRLYLQDTRLFPRHVDFVRYGLGRPINPAQFEAMTYHGADRTAMAGTLILRPALRVPSSAYGAELVAPVTIEFFPSDDLNPAQALLAHRLLEERLLFLARSGAENRLVYVPADAGKESELGAEIESFRKADALHSPTAELYAGVEQQILNAGIAYGTLRRLAPRELATSVVSRRDILVLTSLPNDLPLVGGTITEQLQTPLAHVNLAARARGTPNVALLDASNDPRIAPYLGELVRLDVSADDFSVAPATLEEAEAFWDAERPAPLVPESDGAFMGLPAFDELGFADALRVGAKAANLAELRRLLGDRAPQGFAVPFSAFDAYMADNAVSAELCALAEAACAAEGRPSARCALAGERCASAAARGDAYYGYLASLLDDDGFQGDTELREACLHGLRFVVAHGEVDAEFGAALDARVEEFFGAADARLRSSTNVEDLPEFSGAGLYESYSASSRGERRASQRIREVWASVWTFPAFEERALWNVDERAVRMGVAVNLAIDHELANGVLITQNVATPGAPGSYVNVQLGEFPVANPEQGTLPEILSIVPGAGGAYVAVRQRFSSLSPDAPLLGDAELAELGEIAELMNAHFAPLYGKQARSFALDAEFKIVGESRKLLVKQARPYFDR